MADITIKQGDTRPGFLRYLTQTVDGASSPIVLTTASAVKLLAKYQTNLLTGAASIVTAASGAVFYLWATNDTATVGLYDAEWEVKWNDGGYETIPNDGYFSIEIVADLGGDV